MLCDMLGVKCYVTCCVITVMCEVLYVMYPNDSNTVHENYTNTHSLNDAVMANRAGEKKTLKSYG